MNTTTTLEEQRESLPDPNLPDGHVINGRFKVISKIGAGGMSAVYLAEDNRLRREVAVKVISGAADETARKRFIREATLMAGIHSLEVIQLHDSGCDAVSGLNYYVMDAHLLSAEEIESVCRKHIHCSPPVFMSQGIPGKTKMPLSLEAVLAGDRAVSEETAARLSLQILSALRLIHNNIPQIVHRDLKPSNLIFAGDGHLMLADFGIAKAHIADTESTTSLTMLGAGPGTPLYAAPEQKNGMNISAAADFYSFGLVIYRMLTGGLPGTASALLPSDVSERVSRKWNPLLTALLKRHPEERLNDHESVKRQLVSILTECRRKKKYRSICKTTLTRGLPVLFAVAGVCGAGLYTYRHIREKRAEIAEIKQAREEAARRTAKIERSFDECIAYFTTLTNSVVFPVEGEPITLRSGETLIVPSVRYENGTDYRGNIPWNGPRPSKILLDGGCILFTMPYNDIADSLDLAVRERKSLLENRERPFSRCDFETLCLNTANTINLVGLIDIPIEITARGGTIEADDIRMLTATVRSKLTSADGSPVQVNFICGALSTLEVDKDAFGQGVTYGPGRYFKLVDYSGSRPRIIKWVE